MKIQLKRSSVLDSGSAKQPEAAQLEYGELAVNYNSTDPAIFLKASDNSIVQIAGAGSTGAFSGNYNDLTNKPTIGDGTITLTNDGVEVGTFTVNQVGDTTLAIPATDWTDINNVPLYIQATAPNISTATNGDLWVDLGECPPELKVFSDCDGTAEWRPIEGVPELIVLATVLSGTAQVGQTIQSTIAEAIGGKAPYTFTYKFIDSDGSTLQNTTSNTYTVTSDSISKNITVAAVGTDARGTQVTGPASNVLGPVIGAYAVNTPTLITPAKDSVNISATALTMTCTAFSGTATTYKQTQWQIASDAAFQTLVLDVTNTNETTFTAVPNPALNYETVYYARCRQISNEGVTSQYSTDNSFTTGVNPVDPNVPTATMSGLRFDSDRTTTLSRSLSLGNSANTISFWIKPTKNDFTYVLAMDNGGNQYIGFDATRLLYSAGGTSAAATYSLQLNEWQNVVMSNDTTTTTFYVNGVSVGTAASPAMAGADLNISFSSSGLNGYLSEVYFVDGFVKPPETFGKYFPDASDPDKRWGPLDSTVIEAAINTGPIQPYDTRANTSTVWSSNVTYAGTAAVGITNLFDGNTTTTGAQIKSDATLTLSGVTGQTVTAWLDNVTVVTVNGKTITGTSAGYNEVSVNLGSVQNISTIEMSGNNGSIAGLAIDGRLLVDQGVWNVSQQWSDTNPGPTLASFDNDLTTYAAIPQNTIYTFSTPIPFTDKVEVRFVNDTNSWQVAAKLQGSSAATLVNSPGGTDPVTIASGGGVLEGWQMNLGSASYDIGVAMFIVDGAILVDSGAQWNTSQVWSSGVTDNGGGTIRPVTYIFDGSTSNNCATTTIGTSASLTVSNLGTITTSDTLEVFLTETSSADWQVSGTNITTSNIAGKQWAAITRTGSVSGFTITSIDSNLRSNIAAIRVNGKVLVDKASFGANGFYLPFDPSNTGVNYSSGVVTGSPPSQPWSKAFDGILSAGNYAQSPTAGTSTLTLPSPVAFSSSFKISGFCNTGATLTITGANGAIDVSSQLPTATGTYTLQNITGVTSPISAITLTGTGSSVNCGIWGIAADDVLLVDHNSIGVDASGNQNNFYDQNFALNTTGDIYTGPFVSTDEASINNRGLFSGDLNGIKFDTQGSTATATMTLTSPITTPGTIAVAYNGQGGGRTIGFNNESPQSFMTGAGTSFRETILSCPASITSIQFADATGQGAGAMIGGLIVNGLQLADANIQDTVTDTPLKNYAVLELSDPKTNGLYNGNLEVQGSDQNVYAPVISNVTMSSGKYYSEFTVLQVPNVNAPYFGVGGAAFNNNGGVDNWDVIASTLASSGAVSSGNIVGIAFDADTKALNAFVDGIAVDSSAITDNLGVGPYKFFYSTYGTGQTSPDIAYNFGQQPFVASNVTYDQATGMATIGGVQYSTLFQTWDEATVTGIYYYDKNQSKSIRAYELNRTYGLRAALTSAGIHNLELQPTRTVLDYISCDGTTYLPIEDTSTGLRTVTNLNSDLTLKLDRLETAFEAVLARVFALDSVEIGPLAINGYYPLYYTAAGANAASPTTTNHTHLINGITYYMPDGVTIYHGNYGSSSGSSSSSGGGSYY